MSKQMVNQPVRQILMAFALSILFVSQQAGAKTNAAKVGAKDTTPAVAAPVDGSLDALFQSCEGNWSEYEKSLLRIRTKWQKEIGALSASDYKKLERANDPRIVMTAVHWPLDLKGQDPYWDALKDCSEKNWEIRKDFAKASGDASDRKLLLTKIEVFEGCVLRMFTVKNVIEPVDRLLQCYRTRAAKR